jgi:hypothetical protein
VIVAVKEIVGDTRIIKGERVNAIERDFDVVRRPSPIDGVELRPPNGDRKEPGGASGYFFTSSTPFVPAFTVFLLGRSLSLAAVADFRPVFFFEAMCPPRDTARRRRRRRMLSTYR